MFEASIKAVAAAHSGSLPVIALIGGTMEQQYDWAIANLDQSTCSVIQVTARVIDLRLPLRGRTLAGAVMLNVNYVTPANTDTLIHTLATAQDLVPDEDLILYVFPSHPNAES